MMVQETNTHSFYVVLNEEVGKYYAGFDPGAGQAKFVDNPTEGKLYTNKFEIPLRPAELLVELKVPLDISTIEVSEPFRPRRRKPRQA